MFIDYIIEAVGSGSVHVQIVGDTVILGLYADDLAVSFNTANGLQKYLKKSERYCDKWGVKTN
jgi:hypothetical protein